MKNLLFSALALFSTLFLKAQTTEDSVKTTINQFFEGMKKADTALIRSTMTEGVIFQTITRTKEGNMMVRTENVTEFLQYIAQSNKGVADERITFGAVKIDGNLASVWTPYRFYVNDKFSHCGANSFQMVKLNDKWKIQYLIDTRRRQGCD